MSMNEVVKKLSQAIDKQADKAKTTAYDTPATVRRIEGDTAWVHIPGGVDETPVKLTISAKEGDQVQVRVSGGSAFMVGNGTNPPTDDARANEAYTVATVAEGAAQNALGNAARAKEAADSAQVSASAAESAAGDAVIAAGDAQTAAGNAQTAAVTANTAASGALIQLSVVQDVVGVLDLLAKHGTYRLTDDTEVQPGKWYFTRSGTSPDYVYQVVNNPTGDPNAQGLYELTGIDQAIQNYVSSHLALDNNGLWLQSDSSNARLYLSNSDGVVLYGTSGVPVAKYGSDTYIGDYTSPNGYYIKLDSTNNEIGFYQGSNKVAYMNGAQLYVANSLSFGHFIFYERDNGHFTLKRVS